MKSERRHELEENALAHRLEGGIESLRPYLGWIVAGVGIVVVAFIAMGMLSSGKRQAAGEAWHDYLDAAFNSATLDPETFESVASANPSTDMAAFAEIRAADLYLDEGLELGYSDRVLAHEQLRKASEAYQRGLTALDRGDDPLLRNRAQLGLGRVAEALNQLDDAENRYRAVAEDAASPLAPLAQQRLAALEESSTREFYDWFAETPLADASALSAGASGEFDLPNFDELPSEEEPAGDATDDPFALFGEQAPAGDSTPADSGDEALEDESPAPGGEAEASDETAVPAESTEPAEESASTDELAPESTETTDDATPEPVGEEAEGEAPTGEEPAPEAETSAAPESNT